MIKHQIVLKTLNWKIKSWFPAIISRVTFITQFRTKTRCMICMGRVLGLFYFILKLFSGVGLLSVFKPFNQNYATIKLQKLPFFGKCTILWLLCTLQIMLNLCVSVIKVEIKGRAITTDFRTLARLIASWRYWLNTLNVEWVRKSSENDICNLILCLSFQLRFLNLIKFISILPL